MAHSTDAAVDFELKFYRTFKGAFLNSVQINKDRNGTTKRGKMSGEVCYMMLVVLREKKCS